jgi:SOS-response transcriptional repressor LexA
MRRSRAPEELLLPGGGSIQRVPLLDRVQAGKLTAPSSQIPIEDVPLLAFADLGRGDFFALQVEGTSMDRISPEGSVIVVDRSDKQLVGGKPYIFSLKGGEATYKLWHPGDPAYLEPSSWDASNKPQFVKRMKELFVIGRVRRTLMDL